MMDFKKSLEAYALKAETAIDKYLPIKKGYQEKIYEAMRYSVLGGGKRIRATLALVACEICGGKDDDVLPFAAAVEMVHAYSLVHDDLPAMDDDDMRRGKPSCHKKFGEAMAILAGDGLLGCAFETALTYTPKEKQSYLLRALLSLCQKIGPQGMLGGQVIDIESERRKIDEDELLALHNLKCGALIRAACEGGAIMGGGNETQIKALDKYGQYIGLAFQIKDDILDVEGDAAVLGKATGADNKEGKNTFVTMYGLDGAKKELTHLTDKAINICKDFGEGGEFLAQLARYLCVRNM